jgi:quinol monooxygenase YgiN
MSINNKEKPISDPTPSVVKDSNVEKPTAGGRDVGPVCIIVHGRARSDKVGEAKDQLMKIVDPIRANPDCLEFRVYQDRDDPQSFILWERWVSEEAVFAHGKRDYMAEYMAKKGEIFESLEGEFLQEIHPPDAASGDGTPRPVVQKSHQS